ncbi:MAG: HAD hydrolase-like protein [Candidatus Bathyarchaeia archaeon]
MQKIRAILFDLDNTLSDFMLMKEEACRAAVRAMIAAGLKMTEMEAYSQLMKTYFSIGLESDQAFTEFLKCTGQFDHKILAAAINNYLKAKNNFVKPYPNVKFVLQKLRKKGVILNIVTDAPKTKAFQRLLIMGIEPYFQTVIAFEDTGSKKQTGLPLKLALETLMSRVPGIMKSEILMVGDSIERDLIPAKKLGLRTALSKYGQGAKEIGTADYELTDIKDLLTII